MNPYPKPTAMGGTLIRAVIQLFKQNHFSLPIKKPILIACSGGVDSMALAHLVSRYGRKVIDPKLVSLLHLNHGWRKESATVEREAVRALANELEVGFLTKDLDAPSGKSNAEEDARLKRNKIYEALAGPQKKYRYVFTAHHYDDVVETLIWRFFRGELLEQKQGILFLDDLSLRPLLKVLKKQLRLYAADEGLKFFEDPTNADVDQMRARLRLELIPNLEKSFPGLKRSLARYTEMISPGNPEEVVHYSIEQGLKKFGITSKLNRTQKLEIEKLIKSVKRGKRICLPGGAMFEQTGSGAFSITLEKKVSSK